MAQVTELRGIYLFRGGEYFLIIERRLISLKSVRENESTYRKEWKVPGSENI